VDLVGSDYLGQSLLVERIHVDVVNQPGVDDSWVDVVIETLRHLLSPKKGKS